MRKRAIPTTPIHLFTIGATGIGKKFITKAIYHGILNFHNMDDLCSDPLKKFSILSFTRIAAHNANGVTVH